MVSQHALQVSRPTPKGEVKGSGRGGSPCPHPGGGACCGGSAPDGCGDTPPLVMAAAAGGTHPTGMHSCLH